MEILHHRLFKYLGIGFLIVTIGHLIGVFSFLSLAKSPEPGQLLMYDLFYFNHEKSLTALFSSLCLILAGFYSLGLGKVKSIQDSKYWSFLGGVMIFLGCDEWFAIHDQLNLTYGLSDIGIPVWVLVYGAALLCFIIAYIPFLLRLPSTIQKLLILSGAIYVGGAAIFETFNYTPDSVFSSVFQLQLIAEDGLEMLGILLFIWVCMKYYIKVGEDRFYLAQKSWLFILTIGFLDFIVTYFINLS